MQPNLKPSNPIYQYIPLTLSDIECKQQPQEKTPQKRPNFLTNSNITHSRMTDTERKPREGSILLEDEYSDRECALCCGWKRWGMEQQIKLLRLQEILIQKQQGLDQMVVGLKKRVQEQDLLIHKYNQDLAQLNQQIAKLNSQIIRSPQTENKPSHTSLAYNTPFKNNSTHRNETKMSQMTDDKRGSTAATKPQFQWSAFETNTQKFKLNKDSELTKCLFENKMLKEYNSVLLERLKESKYRKPF